MAVGKSGYIDVTVMPESVGKVRVYWREDYDVEGNYSTITITDIQGYIWHRNGWATISLEVYVNDVCFVSSSRGWAFWAVPDTTLRSVVSASDYKTSFTPITSGAIYHNDDGSKTVNIKFNLVECFIMTAGFQGSHNQSATSAVALTPIPRASSVTATDGIIGAPVTIAVTQANSGFTHTLTYRFGGASGTILPQGSDTAVSWTPPMSLCSQIPDGESGICTVVCDTYSGSSHIGTKTKAVTLTVPGDVGLRVSDGWAAAAPDNTGTKADGIDAYVQGYSKAQVTFDESKISTAEAYGATIKSFSVLHKGMDVGSAHRTSVLMDAGADALVCRVTDSRGRTVTETLSITVQPYTNPSISQVSLFRSVSDGTEADDGTYIYAKAVAGCSSIGGNNSVTLRVRYRVSGGSYGSYTTLTSGMAAVIGSGLVSATSTYEAELSAVDVLGNMAVITAIIPTANAFFHGRKGGKGAAFGKYAEADDLLEVAWNIRGRKNLDVDGAVDAMQLKIGGKALWEYLMPVGYIYKSSDPTSPAALFGGTWEQLKDRVIVGAGGSYAVDSTGGEATHTLTLHEMPSHSHDIYMGTGNLNPIGGVWGQSTATPLTNTSASFTAQTGGGAAHNNMQPYIAKYIWERVE